MMTKCNYSKMEKIRRSLRFENCFTMASVCSSGGLALLWSQDLDLTIQTYSAWLINVLIKGIENSN